ncbi:hybrid sensory histidine kinase in two-component regulatory system with ArcA, regulates respiration and fermentation, senses oxidized quinones [Xenorhabdus nematophila ATCC 19061]|uniref:Aerobic respiration control sensor protein n=1 Tax=Xenorhabdus nematophila (strain ATCC 19061 / DSM 3370 / CCUG 14189 / LMG 1036 / NCIMB 9965 / AN6) TaxID=406817 RepID=D3VDF0_XENNA|nr:aerobic respiration two-component sensor histidine kinase ArcB [Xenorhabdus nematophila]CBJ92190.1 hybrid sensory histidine kinase in two-component regulatory system with ArcA, regulates respiration and fermentation, senses oxidized quinones [Xenorhabdus nematophila ATCC 19061]CEK25005.1 hybrid sensory histidine kinase in two-component regulatory system with ArcA, regulates respiration and fermentation, senses oxidized quinones [Xenorhabdus nematophila AN6/1]
MKLIRGLAQYYVDLMMKLGLVRFSLLLASALVILAMAMQMAVTFVLHGEVQRIDLIRSIFFGLLITPWAVYFLSIVVEQLEESRQRLSGLVAKLEEMRQRDATLNLQLKENISQLNQEIIEREKAEKAHLLLLDKLKLEMEHREKTQIELEQQSVLLRSFLDASPDLVYYRNEDDEFSGCNRAMELLTGKSEKQLIGLTPKEVYDKEIAGKVMETDEKVFRHNVSLTYEQWLVYPDGRKACFELRKVPFYDRVGKRHGLMGFGRDITERKRYQDALENASRDKTTFISTISHELRTPLNGIVGLSRILIDTDVTPEQCNYLKTIHVSAITLGNIFNDIIELDKIERRKVKLDNQPTDFTGFIADLENIAGLLAQPKGIKFVMEPEQPLPAKIMTDGTRLRQILWNMMSNAVKFTPNGKIRVRIWREEGDRLFFEVMDTGIGIPSDELEKIFAMYYQVTDSAGGRPATGTGIGLAVSKRLAQSMGGDITVTSALGHGSCFTLSIVAPAIDKHPGGEEEQDTLPLPALNILLVEDIELNVIVARSVLEKLGNSVDVAMNGYDALTMFDPDEYDLVLLDIQLPDMTGLDIARALHQRYSTLPPLIALTANVLKDKKEYLDAGMDDVLNKPLSVKELTVMIGKYWGKASASEDILQEANIVKKDEERLDTEMLNQYIELVGPKMIVDSLAIFETMMPSYLALLDSNMTARDQKGITEEAHKIKGAAGSVGLRHLQQLAQQIQSPDLPAWWDNVQEWVDELKLEWKNDIEILRNWLPGATKK